MGFEAGTSRSRAAIAAAFCFALLFAVVARSAAYSGGDPTETYGENPCTGPERGELLCPNLRISKPRDLFISRSAAGRRLLHSTSSVNSVGFGPLEIRGMRIPGTRLMRVNQRIHKRGGGILSIKTDGRLAFYPVPGQYRYWKFRDAARFEIWKVDGSGAPTQKLRTGPKFYYCLRDLERTKPTHRSPQHFHYPGCNQDPNKKSVILGTSVGWSDIYPAAYHQQWIEVSGLRGCFAYRMIVDPKENLFESNEDDNVSQRLVRLPYRGEPGC